MLRNVPSRIVQIAHVIEELAVPGVATDPAEDHQHDSYAPVIDPEHGQARLSVELETRMLPGNAGRCRFHVVLFDPIELRCGESGWVSVIPFFLGVSQEVLAGYFGFVFPIDARLRW